MGETMGHGQPKRKAGERAPAGPCEIDLASVPALGAYVAKRCPTRVHNRWDETVDDSEQVPPSKAAQLRMEEGIRFEGQVVDKLDALHGSRLVRIHEQEEIARRAATLEAMQAGALLIYAGELPVDEQGHRVGKPDLLVRACARARPDGKWGYRALDVKHHMTIEPKGETRTLRASPLSEPWLERAVDDASRAPKRRFDDCLQLAHYQRMLEACGHDSPGGAWGGLIGTELEVVWWDLGEPLWEPWVPERRARSSRESTLVRYDFELAFRVEVVANALARPGSQGPPPVKIGECAECEWHDYCHRRLVAADDVSLLPGIAWRAWKRHFDRGVHSRRALAELDWRTAHLMASGVKVADFIDRAAGVPADTPVAHLLGKRPKQAATLAEARIACAGDARRLCPATAAYGDGESAPGGLGRQIDLARAALAGGPFLRRNVGKVAVPRADIEIDLDMESTPDGRVYLWGALVTNRSGRRGLVRSGYRPFVTFAPLGDDWAEEARVLAELWAWLTDLRQMAERAGLVLRIYYYTSVEETKLRALAESHAGSPGVPDCSEVQQLVSSDAWVDLHEIVKDHVITGAGLGLKEVAPLAGFAWRDPEAGGDESMLWYREAVDHLDASRRETSRERLLAYNEDDVIATLRVRDWLEREAARRLPRIAALDRTWPTHLPARE